MNLVHLALTIMILLEKIVYLVQLLTDIDKYGYSGYGIEFDRRANFSFSGGGFGQNVLIFEVDMSFSAHIDNKKRHFNSWKRTNTRIRTFVNHKKNVLD